MSVPPYSVTLHHLSSDARTTGLDFPDTNLPAVTVAQLHDLLEAFNQVATHLTIYEPASPEIRVKTERDTHVIRARHRRLSLSGWESSLRGEDHTVDLILSTITGATPPAKATERPERTFAPLSQVPASSSPKGRIPRWVKITVVTVLIVAVNGFTFWKLRQPARTLVPQYQLLSGGESQDLLTRAAGEYETGVKEGDRSLVIGPDGALRLAKYGQWRSLTEQKTKTVRGVLAGGRAGLLTSDPSLLTIQDADTVVLYGIVYHRRRS